MDIQHLRAFIMVAQLEHLTHAADELHMSQPSVSSAISKLENELNIKLFDRVGRNIRLNNAGKEFLPHAVSAIESIDAGISGLHNLKEMHNMHLSIQSMPLNSFPGLFDRLCNISPNLITTTTTTISQMTDNLISGATDLCLTTSKLVDDRIDSCVLLEEPLKVMVSKKHRFGTSKFPLRYSDLKNETFACINEAGPVGVIKDTGRRGGFISHINATTTNFFELLDFIETGNYITIIGERVFYSLPDVLTDRLTLKEMDGEPVNFVRSLYWRKSDDGKLVSLARKIIIEYFEALR